MTSRERLRRCYFNEELDRPAVYSRTGFPGDDSTYNELKSYLRAHTEMKQGYSSAQFETPYATTVDTASHSEDFACRTTTLHTPKGDLQSTYLVSLKGKPGMHASHFIKNPEDAEKYLSLPYPALGGGVSSFREAEAQIGDRGIVDIGLGFNPAGFVAELCGSESFAMMTVTDRDLVHQLCRRLMTVIMHRVEFLLSQKLGPFFSMLGEEYLVPPLHGPKDFHDFNVQYDKPIIDLIHDAGGRIHIHSHGSIRKVFQGFIDMGADVLHPFEAPPLGDITAEEAKSLARGKLCLEGNIQISRMYDATPEEIEKETSQLIAACFDDHRGLIVCPTASPYVRGEGEECFPQYKAMIDTVLHWQS